MISLHPAPRRAAFTIIEVMSAIFIFGLIIMAIYSTWSAILRGSKVGLESAAEVQRSRIAMRTIEDALLTAQLFHHNIFFYAFLADTSGDTAYLTMVSRLPASFPGVGRYGDQIVRRVGFYVQSGEHGKELVMSQAPMLADTNATFKPYSLVLAREVTRFSLEFWNFQKKEWEEEWKYTNALPALVKVTLGLGHKGSSGSGAHDEISRVVSLPGYIVTSELQGRGPMPGGPPGMPGPNPANPNVRDPRLNNPNFPNPRFQNPGFNRGNR